MNGTNLESDFFRIHLTANLIFQERRTVLILLGQQIYLNLLWQDTGERLLLFAHRSHKFHKRARFHLVPPITLFIVGNRSRDDIHGRPRGVAIKCATYFFTFVQSRKSPTLKLA